MKLEEEQDYSGIGQDTFKIVLSDKFYPWDVLMTMNEEYVVVSNKKVLNGYETKLAPEDLILHKQFLWKYSQFMCGI